MIAITAIAATIAFGAAPASAGQMHGVVADGTPLNAGDYQRMAVGNAGTLRLTVTWRNVEQRRGEYTWGWLDAAMNNAAANGVRILPVLSGPGPRGAADPPTTRAARKRFARFAGKVAARYGRGGSYWDGRANRAPLRAYQVLNEQNGRAYWEAKPNPRAYGKILKAVAKKIRRKDRRAEVVLGGMFGTPGGAGSLYSWTYLKKLYRVPRIKGAFDTVAIHPYSPNLFGIKYQVRRIRGVMGRNGDRRESLRITEFGWGSARRGNLNMGKRGQARMLKKAFGLFERKRGGWNLEGANWYSFIDNPAVPCSFCSTAGLFKQNRDPKPSWRAFKRVARR